MTIPGYQVGTWTADPLGSAITFSVRHFMISKAHGRFTNFDVRMTTAEDPLESSVTATVDLASISTGVPARDDHLLSADYFEVAKYPTMTYESTGLRGHGSSWVVDGSLTLHGITLPVPLTMELNGFGPDPFGGQRAGFSATAEVSRRDFGIDLVVPMAGGVVVGDVVSVSLEIQAVLDVDA